MKLKVIQNGRYPGNSAVLPRLLKGEEVPAEERQDVEVRIGQTLDSEKLDKRIVKSLLANQMVEEVG